jgi:transposase InsO family protein
MTSNINLFTSLNLKEGGVVRTSSGADSLSIKGTGSISLSNEYGNLVLNNVLFIPEIVVNLLSVRCLVLDGYKVQFNHNEFFVHKNNSVVMKGHYIGNLPSLEFKNHHSFLSSSESLHKALGHVSYHRIRHKLGIPVKPNTICEACAVSKITKGSFHERRSITSRPFEEIHLDLVGPISPMSQQGHKYFMTVVDSCTRYCTAIPLSKKSDAADSIIQAIELEGKRIGYFPTVVHSDRGSEFVNQKLMDFYNKNSIRARQSDAYTPQQNGLAERFNRTIIESMRSVFSDSGIPKNMWHEIVKSCTLTLNQIPTHKSKKSPFELFKNRNLPLSYFKPIGIRMSYLIQPEQPGMKLFEKGELGKLVGYNDELQSYRILSDNGRIIESNHVQFLKFKGSNLSFDKNDDLLILEDDDPVTDSSPSVSQSTSVDEEKPLSMPTGITETVQSESTTDTSKNDSESSDDDSEIEEALVLQQPASTSRTLRDRTTKIKPVKYSHLASDPTSFKMAMKSDKRDLWTKAADEELNNIEGHDVWEDMYSQPDSFLRTLWIFKTKPSTLSAEERKKARLCIQGFMQIPGKDYGNTFAPTGKFSSLLILLMFAIDKQLDIRQFDVKSAFLFAPLEEEIYIKTPEGSKRKAPFLKLKKSLYGLKQAPANWYNTLTTWFTEIDFEQSAADPCVFIHKNKQSFLFFHVDDLFVTGNVDQFENLFLKRFPNSSAHDPDTLLGMDLTYDKLSIKLSQKKLIEKGLELAGIRECHPVKTPLSVGIQLQEATQQEKYEFNKLKINYRTHTGLLNYLSCRTRPDLAPAVSILSSFNNAPGIKHWRQVIHCWKYLAGTINLSLTLRPDTEDTSNAIQHYTDATWADDLETRLSRSGSICFWKSCPVSWNSKKQRNITLSSTEAELNALSDGVQENQWIKYLIEELYEEKLNPTNFHVDNLGLIEKIKNFGSNSKTKHLDIKMKWLRDLYNKNEISVKLIPSEEMVADTLTKSSSTESLNKLTERCFLVEVLFSSNGGGC